MTEAYNQSGKDHRRYESKYDVKFGPLRVIVNDVYTLLQVGGLRCYLSRNALSIRHTASKSKAKKAWRARTKLRGEVYDRAGHFCENCGKHLESIKEMSMHHIKPVHLFPELSWDADNCQCLCTRCHTVMHLKETIDVEHQRLVLETETISQN